MNDVLDLLREAKSKQLSRQAADKVARELKKEEERLFAALQLRMEDLNYLTLSDGVIEASIETVQKPYISDYSELESYIVEHRALDLLQKRLTESAVKLRWEDGVQIPGVGISEERKLVIK